MFEGWPSIVAAGVLLLATADPATLLARADAPHDAFSEGVIRMRVTVAERGKPPAESLLDLLVQGNEKSLCIFREGKQKGRRILTAGERLWLIVPGTAKPVPISKSQRLMGAASIGDVAGLRYSDTYQATLRPDDETVPAPGSATPCHVLDLAAKRKGAPYPSAVLWVGTGDGLARRLRLALGSGKPAKEVRFTGYSDKLRLHTMEIRDLLAAGGENVTSLTFESYEAKKLDGATFSPEGARAVP